MNIPLSESEIKELNSISKLSPEEQKVKLSDFLSKLNPEQIEFLQNQQTMRTCPFCDIVSGKISARKVYEDKDVLAVMENVPRHKFMPFFIDQAYEDHPVPIGYSQTISQPYIVALMTQELNIDSSYNYKVLEIGTGSGYQAAVLAGLVDKVYTIEIIKELADSAANTLKNLGYDNVEAKHADGYFGWEEKAPFDRIIITAAANHVPPPLIEQLKDNGKLIIPLASTIGFQTLTLITKKGDSLETVFITGVRFVPMTGEAQKR